MSGRQETQRGGRMRPKSRAICPEIWAPRPHRFREAPGPLPRIEEEQPPVHRQAVRSAIGKSAAIIVSSMSRLQVAEGQRRTIRRPSGQVIDCVGQPGPASPAGSDRRHLRRPAVGRPDRGHPDLHPGLRRAPQPDKPRARYRRLTAARIRCGSRLMWAAREPDGKAALPEGRWSDT